MPGSGPVVPARDGASDRRGRGTRRRSARCSGWRFWQSWTTDRLSTGLRKSRATDYLGQYLSNGGTRTRGREIARCLNRGGRSGARSRTRHARSCALRSLIAEPLGRKTDEAAEPGREMPPHSTTRADTVRLVRRSIGTYLLLSVYDEFRSFRLSPARTRGRLDGAGQNIPEGNQPKSVP